MWSKQSHYVLCHPPSPHTHTAVLTQRPAPIGPRSLSSVDPAGTTQSKIPEATVAAASLSASLDIKPSSRAPLHSECVPHVHAVLGRHASGSPCAAGVRGSGRVFPPAPLGFPANPLPTLTGFQKLLCFEKALPAHSITHAEPQWPLAPLICGQVLRAAAFRTGAAGGWGRGQTIPERVGERQLRQLTGL